MQSQNQLFTVISSTLTSNLSSLNEKNVKNTYNNIANKKLSPIQNILIIIKIKFMILLKKHL